MSIKTVVCRGFDRDALIKGIEQPNVKAVIYFFSVEFERFEVHRVIKQAFPQASCIGTSSMGGWSTGGAVEKGIVAMSLSSDEAAESFVSLQEGVKSNANLSAQRVVEEIKRKSGCRTFSPSEEFIRCFTFEKNFDLNIVGGTAADELMFTRTLVSADEKCSADVLVPLVMKMKIFKEYNESTEVLNKRIQQSNIGV